MIVNTVFIATCVNADVLFAKKKFIIKVINDRRILYLNKIGIIAEYERFCYFYISQFQNIHFKWEILIGISISWNE